jgi:hypothetical protein
LRRTLKGRGQLGLAHGTAGYLLALELGAARFGLRRDADLIERGFDHLARHRVVVPGGGALWPDVPGGQDYRHGWCSGGPGIALALDACARLSGEEGYRQLFEEAAPMIARVPSTNRTVCCGRAGRADILVELYRRSGEVRWLDQARAVIAEPVHQSYGAKVRYGLWQGAAGTRYVTHRLADPMALPMLGVGSSKLRVVERASRRARG